MNTLAQKLAEALPDNTLVSLHALQTGAQQSTYRAQLGSGREVFVKTSARVSPAMYPAEARGLAWLADAHALGTPEVLAATSDVLVLAWIATGPRARDFEDTFGRGLARLHRAGAPYFGHAEHNFVGTLAQDNGKCASFAEFYRARRLQPLVQHAQQRGLLSARHVQKFDTLYTRLDTLCGPPEAPARLHGDLWSGNVMADARGQPLLVDPSVYGGHREMDLAMLQLFGGASARCLAAYDDVFPRSPGHEARMALFQLYPLLVHVALFGASYVPAVSDAIASYVA